MVAELIASPLKHPVTFLPLMLFNKDAGVERGPLLFMALL